MKCAKFVGSFDPFGRPVLVQTVGANIQTGPTSKISVLCWNAPISLVHLTHSDGLPQDDLLVSSSYDWVGIGPVLGQALKFVSLP